MYIRAHRNPPSDVYSLNGGSTYPISNCILECTIEELNWYIKWAHWHARCCITLHCIAMQPKESPCPLYHIWVLPALESLPYFEWYQMLHCIASPELHCITLHCIALQPQSCIALHCSPRYLQVPYPAFIRTWILSIFETLSYPTDIIFKSPWPCQPVQPLSKCESISSKSLWPFKTTQP